MSNGIEQLIPHRPPLCWVDALIDCTETTAVASARFTPEHFAVIGGSVIETALVECMAQTVAAALGQRRHASAESGGGNQGMLAAVSKFKIHSPPRVNQALTIEIHEVMRLGPMLMIAGKISCGAELIATGELSLYA